MVITIQIQIDPVDEKEFSESEQDNMEELTKEFCSRLEKMSDSYLRSAFYVNGITRY